MPRLSVIVTCYNVQDYIEQCLDTVCGQTLEDIEIIVVDDGSTDSTPSVIKDYADRDARIVPVLFEQNTPGGVATAANAGLDRATAPYVGFMDGDDYCEPTMFSTLLAAAERYDSDLAMCRYMLVDEETGELAEPADEYRWIDIDRPVYELDVHERQRFLQFIAVPWRKIYRRRLLEDEGIRFPVGDYFYEDNPFHWFAILAARSIAVVPEVLCYHRVARLGQTMSTVDQRLLRMFMHHDTIQQRFAGHPYASEYEVSLLNWVVSQMEWIAPRTPTELRPELFRALRHIVTRYQPAVVEAALEQGRKGETARALTQSLLADNFAGFAKTLDTGSAASHPLVSARYHLRYSGAAATAKWAARYMIQRYEDRRSKRRRSEPPLPAEHSDLMFGLVLLDRRLEAIESDIRQLRRELSAGGEEAAAPRNLAMVHDPDQMRPPSP